MRRLKICFSVLLAILISFGATGINALSERTNCSSEFDNLFSDNPVVCTVYSDNPYLVVNVINTFTTDITGTKYKYEVFVSTYAEDLGYTSRTKFSHLYILTGIGGSTVYTYSNVSYNYSGSPFHVQELNSFYRSINNPLTSIYVYTQGACVYDYNDGWVPAEDFIGTIVFDTVTASSFDE